VARILWLDSDGHRSHFTRFGRIAAELGHEMVGILPGDPSEFEEWLRVDAYVVRTTIYWGHEVVRDALVRAIDAGARILILRADMSTSSDGSGNQLIADVNPWLTERFDIGLLEDVHVEISRWHDDTWSRGSGRYELVARPSNPVARLDPLLEGIQTVLIGRPRVVRRWGRETFAGREGSRPAYPPGPPNVR
jgi:hypothetical protein